MKKSLIIKKSLIHGKGVFTNEVISKDIFFYHIPLNYISAKDKPRQAKIAENKWVNDPEVLNWVNHSCSPNTQLVINVLKPHLLALRNIRMGEEITVDYNITELGGSKVKCNCRDKHCKGYFLRIE